MTTLKRYDGTQTVYSTSDMEQLLAHLSLSNSAGVSDGSVFFWAAAPYVIIVDLAWVVNRRLSELFQVAVDPEFPFNIAFVSDSEYISLYQALLRSGYAGVEPLTEDDLSRNYMALYQSASGGADAKVLSIGTGSAIVASSGNTGSAATLKGIIGGQGISLSESSTDITISANATPITTIGSGLPLIDPSSTSLTKYIASLSVSNGLTLNRNGGVVSIGLGQTLTLPEDTLPIPSGTAFKTLSDNVTSLTSSTNTSNAAIVARVVALETTDGTHGTRLSNLETTATSLDTNKATVTALNTLGTRVSTLETSDTSQGSRITSLENGRATTASVTALTTRVSTLETSDTSQNSRLTSLETSDTSQTTRITNLENTRATTSTVTELTTRVTDLENTRATSSSVTALTTRVSSLESSDGSQNTRLNSLETTSTNFLLRITGLESTQLSTVSQLNSNTSSISSIQSQISSLQTTASSATVILPFAEGDIDARRKGIPQYSLYRNTVRGGYVMRYLADSAFQMNFSGQQSYSVRTTVDNTRGGWTLEWWAKIPRLFQLTMLTMSAINSYDKIVFGLTGGGAFNVTFPGGFRALANPEVNEWYLFGCMCYNDVITLYMSKQGQVSTNPTFTTVNAPNMTNFGLMNLIVGRDPTDYSMQGSIACPRLVNRPLYDDYIMSRDALRVFTSFPLDKSPDNTVVVLDGNPLVNKVSPSDAITVVGSPTISAVTDYIDNWVPL